MTWASQESPAQDGDEASFPRVLLINHHVFNAFAGAGIALTNYFHGWPREKIAAIYGEDIEPDRRICDTFFRLSHREMGFPRLLAPLETRRWWRPAGPNERGDGSPSGRGGEAAHYRLRGIARAAVGAALRRAKQLVSADGVPTRADLTPALDAFIRRFAPEVIFATLGNLGYIRLTERVARRYGIPLVIQITDDWPSILYRQGILARHLNERMRTELADLLGRAAVRIAISDSMNEAYERRYGADFMTITPPVDVREWSAERQQDHDRPPEAPFELVYMGTIVENAQFASLRDVGEAVKTLHQQAHRIALRVYTPLPDAEKFGPQLAAPPAVTVVPAPPNRDAPAILGAADLLVVPVNFDAESVRYIRYSMPGKVPAYMATGTPILVYGPPDVAPVQYAREYGWGHVVSRRAPADLAQAIKNLAADEQLRSRLGGRAQELARERHDTTVVRREFRRALRRAAAGAAPRTEAGRL